jgi:hypothetical protein
MWSMPQQDEPEERCNRLISLYELQIQELEATRATPYWDGEMLGVFCSGLMPLTCAGARSQPARSRAAHQLPPLCAAVQVTAVL